MTRVGGWAARLGRWGWVAVSAVVLALVLGGAVTARVVWHDPAQAGMPLNADFEQSAGIRFTRVAVVADGGLLEASYVVLDPEKATRFQSDRAHPPAIESEERSESTNRVALMKQGHQMRAGQSYYLVYNNRGGVVQAGETARIVYNGFVLQHVPVIG
ncbi:MAG: hypothetical protein ABJA33_07270 [Pedococcus sp.]